MDFQIYSPSNILNQSQVIVMFKSGAGVEVLESKHYMAARVYLPWEFIVSCFFFTPGYELSCLLIMSHKYFMGENRYKCIALEKIDGQTLKSLIY